ncbi:MAG: 4Fe-4S dicluster domain-containing protein [Desulfobacteraceae bacterium]|nr:MAG: 4Fe-4S dicluster domain-containing protein [Desulfobacteraceae bacterium]
MRSTISRRSFLKGSVAATVAAAMTPPAANAGNALKSIDGQTRPLATLIDIQKCIGCEECVYACQESNQAKFPEPQKPFPKMFPKRVKVSDWSGKREVTDRLTPYNWLYIQRAAVTIDGEEQELTIPRRCMHCENPPCVKLCPWGAAKQLDNGISRLDADICLGGSKCKQVCPWQIPQRQTGVGLYLDLMPSMAGNGVMYKCDRCYNRIEQGDVPACIEACPEGVQTIGPREEIVKQAHALAREINGYIYGEHENGGTHTIYVSPVPFDQLNQHIETGDGQPHLKPVKDMMADGARWTRAMILAPIAGAAAAFGRFYKGVKETEK